MTLKVPPSGPKFARILIVGEAPGRNEVLAGKPFVGAAGRELDKMLHEAGILRTECFITNVSKYNPPGNKIKSFFLKDTPKFRIPGPEITEGLQELKEEIVAVKPNIIIPLGDVALWAVTGERGITKWRGSLLHLPITNSNGETHKVKVIPTYHPAAILRKWDWRFIAVHDLRRAAKESQFPEYNEPHYDFIIRPTFEQVMRVLGGLEMAANGNYPGADGGVVNVTDGGGACGAFVPNPYQTIPPKNAAQIGGESVRNEHAQNTPNLILSGDIETRQGFISCFGIGWSKSQAMCIPFLSVDGPLYWTEEEEIAVVQTLHRLFRNPNIGWVFQNGLYDFQYFAKLWGFIPKNFWMDTMLAHHTCWSGLPKGLDFQSSLYCQNHRYWKDEGKEFHEGIKTPYEEEKYWSYNCKDCVATYEIAEVLSSDVIPTLGQEGPVAFQMSQVFPVLKMMLRGVRVDSKKKKNLFFSLSEAIASRESWLEDVLQAPLNIKSPKQMQKLFYEDFGLPVQKNKKTRRPTTDNEALTELKKKEPALTQVINVILELRSLNVFLSTFVKAPLSPDGRMRSSYNIAGTETFRWSSSKDAFGDGMNLQNIPKGSG